MSKPITIRSKDNKHNVGSISTQGKDNPPTASLITSAGISRQENHTDRQPTIEKIRKNFMTDKKDTKYLKEEIESSFNFFLNEVELGEYTINIFSKGSKHDAENKIGWIRWQSNDEGRIAHIEIAKEYRRRGLATFLYDYAKTISLEKGITPPRHHEVRTEAGEEWANSIGDEVPEVACAVCSRSGHYYTDGWCMEDDLEYDED